MAVSSWMPRSISRKICRRSSGCCAAAAANAQIAAIVHSKRFQLDGSIDLQDTMVGRDYSFQRSGLIAEGLNFKELLLGRRKRSLQGRISGQRHVCHQQAEAKGNEDPPVAPQESPTRLPQISRSSRPRAIIMRIQEMK